MNESALSEPATNPEENEIVVIMMRRRESKCGECGRELFKGNLLRMENGRPLCLDCADLGHLEYLPRGDAAVTRRATKYSPLRAVVVQWSRTRKRYERQGILALPSAIAQAEEESLADADLRARRRIREALRREAEDVEFVSAVAQAIRAQFPGCPSAESEQIAAHACEKHSGRVGRSAAAKELDQGALRLAVVAHIRHTHTKYDELLGRTGDRPWARAAVADEIQNVLEVWEQAGKAST